MAQTRILIFGHSLIHWLNDYQLKNKTNLDLDDSLKLNFRGIRGGSFHWRLGSKSKYQKKMLSAYLSEEVKAFSPMVVYLQFGGNDLDVRHCDIDKIITKVESIANFLLEGFDSIKLVCIGHAFKRLTLTNTFYEDYESRRLLFNAKLNSIGVKYERIFVFPNQGFYNEVTTLYDSKGIHLSDLGNEKFATNLKRILIFSKRKLLQ
ncbi:unnamed protein product [Owenia fusiformis]|uniref:Uncharacterized protein n=1 Tax=Owenia fusiformis TaxID=6347 RepID=A0A8J1TFJ1_OWEFU|nr:unnamed protein product [Owenia fusiformis]